MLASGSLMTILRCAYFEFGSTLKGCTLAKNSLKAIVVAVIPTEAATAAAETTRAAADPLEQLRFIRQTMESAGSFTAVPGAGQVWIGVTALAAAWAATRLHTLDRNWLALWMVEAVVAIGIAAVAMTRKARRNGQPLWSGPARKFVLSFVPPLAVGALLTLVLEQAGATTAIPAMWLLMYGTAVVTGGAFSVGIVPVMGLCFLVLGTLAALTPAGWADLYMAAGFGGLHLVFGTIIARRHGG